MKCVFWSSVTLMVPLSELDTHNYTKILEFKEALASRQSKMDIQVLLPDKSLNNTDQDTKIIHKLHEQQKRLNKKEIAEIIQEYKKGAYMAELALRFGCNRTTVMRQLRKAGVYLPKNI